MKKDDLGQINIEKIKEMVVADKEIRRNLVYRSHIWFSLIFLNHLFEYKFAPFQREMFKLTEDVVHKIIAIMAFRGSGKSTIVSLSYVLWSILGIQEKRCVVIISKSQLQVKMLLSHIIEELETNDLLTSVLGPFKIDDKGERGALSVELETIGARIFAISRGQSVRGLRHGRHRPDLIVIDDIDDLNSVNEWDRKFTYEWFQSEILPIGDENTKIMAVGNLVHADSFMMKLKDYSEKNKDRAIFRAYPLLDNHEKILWPDRYTPEDIKNLQTKYNYYTFRKEYLLRQGFFRHDPTEFDLQMIAEYLSGDNNIDCPCKKGETITSFMKGYCISAPTFDEPRALARSKMFESEAKNLFINRKNRSSEWYKGQ